MTPLRTRYASAIEAAISKAKAGAEAYAYPKPRNRIGWGINAAQRTCCEAFGVQTASTRRQTKRKRVLPDEFENLVLEHLHAIQADVSDVKVRMTSLEESIAR